MNSLMCRVMDQYPEQLMKHNLIDLTSTFFVSFVADISRAPLRLKAPMKQKLIGYFKNGFESKGDKCKLQWIQWMLQYRNDMNRASRDILTRLALALVVQYGHDSCKKCGRIQHEMEKAEDAEVNDDDTKMEDVGASPQVQDWTKIQSEETDVS